MNVMIVTGFTYIFSVLAPLSSFGGRWGKILLYKPGRLIGYDPLPLTPRCRDNNHASPHQFSTRDCYSSRNSEKPTSNFLVSSALLGPAQKYKQEPFKNVPSVKSTQCGWKPCIRTSLCSEGKAEFQQHTSPNSWCLCLYVSHEPLNRGMS